jgi:hypothetical protein
VEAGKRVLASIQSTNICLLARAANIQCTSMLAGARRYVLEDAGPDALVLVDELGKGTEARAGTALAAAFLERLAQAGCRGMFATCACCSSFLRFAGRPGAARAGRLPRHVRHVRMPSYSIVFTIIFPPELHLQSCSTFRTISGDAPAPLHLLSCSCPANAGSTSAVVCDGPITICSCTARATSPLS